MKKILSAFIICFLIFWAGRIISINQNPPITAYYDIGDTLDCGDLEVSFIESHLDSPEQFKERFDVESDNSDGEHKVISICISATNKSDKEADLDEIFDFLECGFASRRHDFSRKKPEGRDSAVGHLQPGVRQFLLAERLDARQD